MKPVTQSIRSVDESTVDDEVSDRFALAEERRAPDSTLLRIMPANRVDSGPAH